MGAHVAAAASANMVAPSASYGCAPPRQGPRRSHRTAAAAGSHAATGMRVATGERSCGVGEGRCGLGGVWVRVAPVVASCARPPPPRSPPSERRAPPPPPPPPSLRAASPSPPPG
eukprot:scaffold72090_cov37-Phaeocystis_antarctica.AAC.1